MSLFFSALVCGQPKESLGVMVVNSQGKWVSSLWAFLLSCTPYRLQVTLRVAGGGLLCGCHPEQSEGREGRRRTEVAQCSWALPLGLKVLSMRWSIGLFLHLGDLQLEQLMSQSNRQGCF